MMSYVSNGAPGGEPPSVWGPHFWKTMDYVARSCGDHPTPEKREAARQFFLSLQHLLPCEKCCGHYQDLLRRRPVEPNLHCGEALCAWVSACKAEVSERVSSERGLPRGVVGRRPNVVVHPAGVSDQPVRGTEAVGYTPANRRRAAAQAAAQPAVAARGAYGSRPLAAKPGGCGCGK